MGMDVGTRASVRRIEAPDAYVVTSGRLHLDRLEDGFVRHLPETHVFIVSEATGDVMIHGERGTFAACWPANVRAGRSLHHFLLGVGFDYFMTKAYAGDHMEADIPRTLRDMRDEVLEHRRAGTLNRARARNLWNLIDEDLADAADERALVEAVWRDGDLSDQFASDGPWVRRRPKAGLVAFWDEAWEAFRREALVPRREAEIAAEAEREPQAAA